MVPSPRLVALIALGAPLWLLSLSVPAGWLAGVGYLTVLAGLVVFEYRGLPGSDGLEVERRLGRLAFATPGEIRVTVTNRSGRTLRVQARDEIPPELGAAPIGDSARIVSGQSVEWGFEVCPVRRGHYTLDAVVVRVMRPGGFVSREVRVPVPQNISVYPRFATSEEHRLLARLDRPDDASRRSRRIRGRGTDFESLTTYTRGDDPRTVDWKASAKRGFLVVRNLQTERGQQISLMIDGGRLMSEKIGEYSRFEHALNAAVMLSHVAQKRGDTVAVATFSDRVESFTPPIRGRAILPTVMDSLCAVQIRQVESDYWQVVGEVMAKLKRRSLLIMMTDVMDVAAGAGLINNMMRAARRHLVLCVVMTERRIDEAARTPPEDVRSAFLQAAAGHLKVQRQLALERMRARGILVLESPPDHLTVDLIRRYLEIRKANLQ